MKSLFIPVSRYNTATPAEGGAVETAKQAPVAKIYTNDKIVELQAAKKAKFAEMVKIDPDNVDALTNANLEIFKLQKDIEAEIANMKGEERKQEIAMKMQERIKIREDFEAALLASIDANSALAKIAVGKRTPEQIEENNAVNDALKAAREKLDNELLARYATSTPAKSVATGEPKESSDKSKILELHLANVANNMTDAQSRKALEDAGYKRSTVWHAVNNYNKSKQA